MKKIFKELVGEKTYILKACKSFEYSRVKY